MENLHFQLFLDAKFSNILQRPGFPAAGAAPDYSPRLPFIGGQGMTRKGGRGKGVGGQNRSSKNLIFKRFAAKCFSKVSKMFSKGQKGSVNLTYNAFFTGNFHLGTLWFPGVEGVV